MQALARARVVRGHGVTTLPVSGDEWNSSAPRQPLEDYQKGIDVDWLRDELNGPQSRHRSVADTCGPGHDHGGNVTKCRISEQFVSKLPAVHPRHVQIRDDHGWENPSTQLFERVFSVGGGYNSEALYQQEFGQSISEVGVILDQQDQRRF